MGIATVAVSYFVSLQLRNDVSANDVPLGDGKAHFYLKYRLVLRTKNINFAVEN